MKPKLLFLFALCIDMQNSKYLRSRTQGVGFYYVRDNMGKSHWETGLSACQRESVMNQNACCMSGSVCRHRPWSLFFFCFFLDPKAGQVGHARAKWARQRLPLRVRAGQWRWGRWRGRGRGRCRGLLGRGLRERRHRNTSADRETKSNPGRQPLRTPLDGRMPLQLGWMAGVGICNQTSQTTTPTQSFYQPYNVFTTAMANHLLVSPKLWPNR